MMEALLNALYEITVSENGSVEDLAEQAMSLSSEGAAVSPLHGGNSDEKDTVSIPLLRWHTDVVNLGFASDQSSRGLRL